MAGLAFVERNPTQPSRGHERKVERGAEMVRVPDADSRYAVRFGAADGFLRGSRREHLTHPVVAVPGLDPGIGPAIHAVVR